MVRCPGQAGAGPSRLIYAGKAELRGRLIPHSDKPEANVLAPTRQVIPAHAAARIFSGFDHAVCDHFIDRTALRARDALSGCQILVGHAATMLCLFAGARRSQIPGETPDLAPPAPTMGPGAAVATVVTRHVPANPAEKPF